MFTSIAGRGVVVTGGTRGIGKGIARVFANSGARVLITGRDADAAKAAAAELAGAGGDVSYLLADVSVRADCARMAETAGVLVGDDQAANGCTPSRVPRPCPARRDRLPVGPGRDLFRVHPGVYPE